MTHYNTTHEPELELKRLRTKADNQDSIITTYFRMHKVLSPAEATELANRDGYPWPIHSVRRSLNTLVRKSILDKTDKKREGAYGRNEHIWKLREEE